MTRQPYIRFTLSSLLSLVISGAAYAAQPLSESDMGEVSAETGQNILNLFGPTAAGLEDDVSVDSTEAKADDTSKESAVTQLEDAERESTNVEASLDFEGLSFEELQAAVEASQSHVVRQAKAFDTTSEMNYDEHKFIHEAEFLTDGSVLHRRDLQVELLKLENLRGDYRDSDRTAGSIYLVNWHSQGKTHIQYND